MTWELYACRYGSQPDLPAARTAFHPERLPEGSPAAPFGYFFWVARSADTTVAIDCGFTPEQARTRGRTMLARPADLLGEIGIGLDDVDDLILTHLHYDHAGNVGIFPKARIHVHTDEWKWATSPDMADGGHARFYEPDTVATLIDRLFAGRLHFLDGAESSIRGMVAKRLGGHCPGQMVVEIPTRAGNVVLASDAAHLAVNVDRQNPFPFVHDLNDIERGLAYLAMRARAGARIIPGHDPCVFAMGKPVGTSGNIVALHEAPAHVR